MYLVVVTFDLSHSSMSFDALRTWVVREAVAQYRDLPGVAFKAWFSDEQRREWGAIYVVADRDALRRDRLPRRSDGHTGPLRTTPTSVRWFELEAFVEGPEGLDGLSEEGLALLAVQASDPS